MTGIGGDTTGDTTRLGGDTTGERYNGDWGRYAERYDAAVGRYDGREIRRGLGEIRWGGAEQRRRVLSRG